MKQFSYKVLHCVLTVLVVLAAIACIAWGLEKIISKADAVSVQSNTYFLPPFVPPPLGGCLCVKPKPVPFLFRQPPMPRNSGKMLREARNMLPQEYWIL